jgi:hypothetical protein
MIWSQVGWFMPIISALRRLRIEIFRPAWVTLSQKTKKQKTRAGRVTQVVEHLPSTCEAQSSNPSTTKKQNSPRRYNCYKLICTKQYSSETHEAKTERRNRQLYSKEASISYTYRNTRQKISKEIGDLKIGDMQRTCQPIAEEILLSREYSAERTIC